MNNDKRDIAAIKDAIRLGIIHLDTAEMYAGGHAEELIGSAIKEFDREKLFIVSKVLPQNLRYDDVIRACKASLKRLAIKNLDLYLIHGPNPEIPIEESMEAMNDLMDLGLTKYIGVSNFNWQQIEAAQAVSKHKIVNNQIHYNLMARAYEENGTLEYCRKNKILITAWRPTAKGEFSKRHAKILDDIAVKYEKTPIQVALNWVISKPNIVTVFKTSNPSHLRENLGALGWELEQEHIKELDAKFERGETRYVGIRPR